MTERGFASKQAGVYPVHDVWYSWDWTSTTFNPSLLLPLSVGGIITMHVLPTGAALTRYVMVLTKPSV